MLEGDMPREIEPPKHPSITLDDALARVEMKDHPKVTVSEIEARIGTVQYLKHNHLIVCVITMKNGFMVVGHSAPADPRNYDEDVGKRFAYDSAFRQLWPLEGYLLKEALHRRKREQGELS